MEKILLVDDEWKLRRLIRDYLQKEGYVVKEASDGEEALDFFKTDTYEMIILDVMMPKRDGWNVLEEIRKDSSIPVIMLTAREEESDQLLGYDLGVDEYITKPFNPKLLVAKIKAILRRGKNNCQSNLTLGELVISLDKREVTLSGNLLELSPKEFELLYFFMENTGVSLSREKILTSVWGWDYDGDERTVDTHIKRIRKKIGEEYIQTVRGFGYKLSL
ncbi:response regulator transcription factor [Cetobacterium sp. SF1]|uniref:response regulator transcription factor n=1 Tax=unclassified Cetobacterium TaxID=2630983 RepID=UPI003CEB6DBC